MSTLTDLRSRIADDIARSDLTTQINQHIAGAVRRYEGQRFNFNEFYRLTATISSGSNAITFAQLGITPLQIDRISLQRNSTYWAPLMHVGSDEMEDLQDVVLSTEPGYWAIQGTSIVFDTSANANYAVVIDGIKQIASASASAAGGDTSAWYNEAQDLIRACAKKTLYSEVIKDDEEAQRAALAEADALAMLRAKTVNKRATGYIRPTRF